MLSSSGGFARSSSVLCLDPQTPPSVFSRIPTCLFLASCCALCPSAGAQNLVASSSPTGFVLVTASPGGGQVIVESNPVSYEPLAPAPSSSWENTTGNSLVTVATWTESHAQKRKINLGRLSQDLILWYGNSQTPSTPRRVGKWLPAADARVAALQSALSSGTLLAAYEAKGDRVGGFIQLSHMIYSVQQQPNQTWSIQPVGLSQ